MKIKTLMVIFLGLTSSSFLMADVSIPQVVVGSKAFTESVILGEVISHLVNHAGAVAEHKAELGGTTVLWHALLKGEIDVYPEYTGTISQEILAGQNIHSEKEIRDALLKQGIHMSRPLGFNNTYAIGMKESLAEALNIHTLSDLTKHPQLRFGFSNEFMDRGDGWPSLRDRYRLPQVDVKGLEHAFAYQAIESENIHLTDMYSTDAEIQYYNMRVLKDDLAHFPEYYAVLLYRQDLKMRAPRAVSSLLTLEGGITEAEMIHMNTQVKLKRVNESQVAAMFLKRTQGVHSTVVKDTFWRRLARNSLGHLYLVFVSLIAAILVAIPLGILSAKRPKIGQGILGVVGIIQTIPSLALLVFMIPLLGIGAAPAIVALFFYSLLPIVRNTYTGLKDIPVQVRDSSVALGLPTFARLWLVEMPLASRAILAGIKTSAIINIGTATLGALIGAGGYGQPILTGIRLDNMGLILEGAVPAALLAILVQGMFEVMDRTFVPKGLRLKV